MRIVVINKDRLENIPPLISVIYHLNKLGHQVNVITTGFGESLARVFREKGIEWTVIPDKNRANPLLKIWGYYTYRRGVLRALDSLSFDCLWVEGGNTVWALGPSLAKYRYILQISELYENAPRFLKAIGKVVRGAGAVVLPEYNRAALYQVWFSLKERPIVLPNIPAFLPGAEELEGLEAKYSAQLEPLKGKTVVLYQGHIAGGRDLTSFAKAVQELGEGYILLLVGKDYGSVSILRKHCDRICHIDFTPAPDYLVFTKHADIGILSYDPTSENNIFCAPNKLFEYSAYGVPMLGNDIPGLKYMIEPYRAGKIVDEADVESIKDAIREIAGNKEAFRKQSKAMYDSFDNLATVSAIVNKVAE